MAGGARAAAALGLLLAPALAAAGPAPPGEVTWLLAPDEGPADGGAVAFRVGLSGPAGARWEVKAWLEGPGVRGAQASDGAGWQRADRYLPRWSLDGRGQAEGWLAVRAAEAGEGPWTLLVRARDEAGRVAAEGARPLAPPEPAPRAMRGLAHGDAWAVGALRGRELVALAPVHPWGGMEPPWDLPGAYALHVPAGAEAAAWDRAGMPLGPLPPAPTGLRLEGFLADAAGDEGAEHVLLRNPGAAEVPLAGWSLAGGGLAGAGWEAVLGPGALPPGGTAALARDALAYGAATGRADLVAGARVRGAFRLPDEGGRVELRSGGALRDAVAWGDAGPGPGWEGPALPALGPGLVHRRRDAPDTDRAADFEPGPWKAGWEPRGPLSAEAEVVPFGREDALRVALAALARAREEVLVEVYLLTHPGLAAALREALARGARVGVLVEGAPVGGMPAEMRGLLDALAAAGAEVRTLGGSGRDRFATLHAKFAVLDRAEVLLGSENWTPSGFSEDGRGNLGWGAWVRSPALARELADVWARDADPARADVAAWVPRGPGAALAPSAPPPPLQAAERARAMLLLVPENARPALLALLAGAREGVDVQSLQLPLAWQGGPSPVVEALKEAALRGARVRVLLDDGPDGTNAATAAALQAWAGAHGAPLEARVARDARVHNKGVVVDGALALVGSANLAEAGLTWNREAALLLEGPAASALAEAFARDWTEETPGPPERADPVLLAAPLAGLALLAVARSRGARR